MTAVTDAPLYRPPVQVHRVFSVSAADAYGRCPRAYAERNARDGDSRHDPITDTPRRRGMVLHDAMQVALHCAQAELATRGAIGGRMSRYWGPARGELGAAWDRHKMPSVSAEAVLVEEMLRTTLDALPVPAPGALHSIETERIHTIPAALGDPAQGEISIKYKPDWTMWVGRRTLRVTDWKSGAIAPEDVRRHEQLHAYAAWLLADLGSAVRDIEIELYSLRRGEGFIHPVNPARAARAAARIETAARTAFADVEFAPKPGPQCGACYFRAVCPAVGKVPTP